MPESQIYRLNICESHRYLTHQAVEAYVATFVNTHSRVFQEDRMLAKMLKSSLTKKAFLSITMDPDTYEVNGHQSGLMLLKTILDKSPINSSIDPDVIRKEIANTNLKFKELGWDVRLFNDWIVLKQAQLTQSGQRSSDITTHLWTAYLDSQDKEFKDFIVKLRDDVLIKDPRDLSVTKLMGFAKKKFDQLETERRLMAVERKRDDEFVALQMKIKKFEQRDRAGNPGKQHPQQPRKDKRKAAERKARKKEKKEGKWKPLPESLKSKPEPADLTKPVKVDGDDWWYCKKHKWCKHANDKCKGYERKADDPNIKADDRGGRAVRAVSVLVQQAN